MAIDFTTNDITNPVTSTAAAIINDNFDVVKAALVNAVSRTDTVNNSMSIDFDMNGNDILNVGTIDTAALTVAGQDISTISAAAASAQAVLAAASAAEAAASALAAAGSATSADASDVSATATLAAFNLLYLGSFTTALEPTGTATGQLYFNSDDDEMKVYDGATWDSVTIPDANSYRDWVESSFVGDGILTAFTLTEDPGVKRNLFVSLDGVLQSTASYNVSGTTLTMTAVVPNGVVINTRSAKTVAYTVGTIAAGAVNTTELASSAVTGVKIAAGTITNDKLATPAITIGEVKMFGFITPPSLWLICDGGTQLIATYPLLFAEIGTTFGGDGATTFGIPDLRGRAPVHHDAAGVLDSGRVFGSQQAGAFQTHTHTASSSSDGAHTHTYSQPSISAVRQTGASNTVLTYTTGNTSSAGAHVHTITVIANGGPRNLMDNTALMFAIYAGE